MAGGVHEPDQLARPECSVLENPGPCTSTVSSNRSDGSEDQADAAILTGLPGSTVVGATERDTCTGLERARPTAADGEAASEMRREARNVLTL